MDSINISFDLLLSFAKLFGLTVCQTIVCSFDRLVTNHSLVALIDALQQFRVHIDCDNCDEFDEISVIIATPSGNSYLPHIIPTSGGFLVNYIPEQSGNYAISVLLNSILVPGSPFYVYVFPRPPKPDISELCSLVRAFGPGLSHGTVNKVSQFLIDAKEANHPGNLSVLIDGPSQSKLDCRDNSDGTCSVAYLCTVPGKYVISVLFDGYHINSSPFTAIINSGICLRLIRVYGISSGQLDCILSYPLEEPFISFPPN